MSDLKRRRISQQEVLVVAIGLVIGFALKDFIEEFIAAFITPILDKIMGGAGALVGKSLDIFGVQFKPGVFVNATINFFAIVFVVYVMVRIFNTATSRSGDDSKKEVKKD